MKRLVKFVALPAVMLVASVFATPSTADAGYGYGYGYGYRPYHYNTYYTYPSYYYTYPVYNYGFCY